ncbi:LysR family transcriptional regulator [Paraburkholderia antibiotica]|uniref:LysR family transcriptional regulator n=1 Tax=Paraburkholderia antibiotica TaxID=2728839 RepID=A0A7X9X2L0_9BURK|nr:LysR family transcriptional regulator [Paraburkholderia antibiotica]NML30272.1 LysR family transcriptional regulator [Paraburkholderia antibiotica]
MLDSLILGSLRCFEAAARLLSFTKAAQSLNLTQSAVSQQIRNLESRLGYPLFLRQSRGLVLTAKGKILFDSTTRAFADIDTTLRRLAPTDTPLHLSCLPSFALQWLMPRLTEFHRQQPEVAVRLEAEFQTLDEQAMEAFDIDVAVRYDPVEYTHLHTEVLLDEYLLAVATPEYLAAHPDFAAGVSLDGVVLLHDATPWIGASSFVEWRTWLEAHKPAWLAGLEGPQFNLSSLAISAALNHQGVAMGRGALVYNELKSGRLVDVFGKQVIAPARYVMLSRRPDDRRVAIFSAWLKAECAHFDSARRQLLQPAACSHE